MQKTFKFTLHCLEKDFIGKTILENKGNNLEEAALNYISKYFNDKEENGNIEDKNTIEFYGYIFSICEV